MHPTPRFVRRAALALLAAGNVLACGGSASETPPPLEPNPHAIPPPAPAPAATHPEEELERPYGEAPARAAPDTWSRPRRHAVDAGLY
jgi:hypothetical protein